MRRKKQKHQAVFKVLREIRYKTIPNKKQRYPTIGDYFKKGREEEIRVSDMKNSDYEFLVLIHELIEWYLTEKRGIKQKDIDAFDITYEKERNKGLHKAWEEPGFDKRAPYLKEHTFATEMEKLLAKEMGVNWKKYENTQDNL